MTTATVPTITDGSRAHVAPASFADVVRSEWRKFRTVRSTYWSVLVAVIVGIGLSALISWAAGHHYANMSPTDKLQWDPAGTSTSGMGLAQLAIAVLGVLTITSEYSTGLIQVSMAAVPRRHRILAAKALIYGVVALIIGEVLGFVAFSVGQVIIHANNAPSTALGHHDVLRAVIGPGLYLGVLGLLALAVGTIVRSSAAGIAIVVAFLYVLPGIAAALPSNIEHTVEKFWPSQAGSQITNVYRSGHTLSPWLGLGWWALFTAIVLAIALYVLRVRDV